MGRITICPSSTTGRSLIACIPSMALCGGFKMGVESIEPKIPPLVIVKVPPVNSSKLSLPSRARPENSFMAFSTSANPS